MTFNLEINNKNLAVYHLPLLELQEVCHLTTDKAAGSGTLTVDNISGFSVGQYILLGNLGESNAEIIRIHTSTAPTGSTITLASNTVFDHYTDTPVTVLDYNQVEFSRSTSLSGAKSVLTTQSISADRWQTVYTDLTNTTGYGWARFKNSSTSVYSDYTAGVAYTGNTYLSFEAACKEACAKAGVAIGDEYATEQQLVGDANEAQDYIGQKGNWAFELVKNDTSITTTENENTYALSALTYTAKFPKTYQGILNVKFGNSPLKYVSPDVMDGIFANVAQTTLAATATVGATSITLTDSNEFADEGVVYAGENTITYTANNKSTGVLSGISASDITVEVTSGGSVWQGVSPGVPQRYTIFNGNIILDTPVNGDYAGYKLKVKYLKVLDRITDFSSTLEVPFYNAVSEFMAGKIEARKRNMVEAANRMKDTDALIDLNYKIYKIPTLQQEDYYNFTTIEDVLSTNDRWGNGD